MRDSLISFPMFGENFVFNPPSSYTIFGFTLYTYGAIIALGFMVGILYCLRRSKDFDIKQDDYIDMMLFATPSAIVGLRLYYVAFNFREFSGNLWRIFSIREGGMAIYGGIIASVLALFLVCRYKKISAGRMLDLGCFGLLIGQSIGRWGNFTNRECFGYETDVPWRMGLISGGGYTVYVHPAFLYESLWNLLGFVLLHFYSKKVSKRFDGQIFLLYVMWYGIGRAFIEGLRTDSLYIGGTGIRASQLLAAVSAAASAALIAYFSKKGRGDNSSPQISE